MAVWVVGYTWAMDVGCPELALCRDIGCVGSGAGVRIVLCLSGAA